MRRGGLSVADLETVEGSEAVLSELAESVACYDAATQRCISAHAELLALAKALRAIADEQGWRQKSAARLRELAARAEREVSGG
jgi:hypothetical protein